MNSTEIRFGLGDMVWWAAVTQHEYRVQCPDCGETKKIHVTLWDGSEYDIDCAGCTRGYGLPAGFLIQYRYEPTTSSAVVTGIEIKDSGPPEYKLTSGRGSFRVEAEFVAATVADALAVAQALAAKRTADQAAQLQAREKPTRSWAWHVHYYRREIRDAKRRIELAEEKLGIALAKTKTKTKTTTKEGQ